MALGYNAYLYFSLAMHINTPYSTLNAIKWPNAWGMGWAMAAMDIPTVQWAWGVSTGQLIYGVNNPFTA
jgi:hypothetical protein